MCIRDRQTSVVAPDRTGRLSEFPAVLQVQHRIRQYDLALGVDQLIRHLALLLRADPGIVELERHGLVAVSYTHLPCKGPPVFYQERRSP